MNNFVFFVMLEKPNNIDWFINKQLKNKQTEFYAHKHTEKLKVDPRSSSNSLVDPNEAYWPYTTVY